MRAHVIAALLLLGCQSPEGGRCAVVYHAAELTLDDRYLVGDAAPYPADASLRARDEELRGSQQARREVAWAVASRVLAPVTLAHPVGGETRTLPRFQTWYTGEELTRSFTHAYAQLDDAARARGTLSAAELDEAFAWNVTSAAEQPGGSARLDAYADSLEGELGTGLGGISRVSYSPAAARHLLGHYGRIADCTEDGAPSATLSLGAPTSRVTRVPLVLDACEHRRVGPYFLADGESLSATLTGGGELALVDEAGATTRCDGTCEVTTGGAWFLEVSAAHPRELLLEVTFVQPSAPFAPCLDEAFPSDAVIVKADFRRVGFGFTLPTFDTSAEGLARALANDGTWEPTGTADPDADAIYTLTLPSGARYRLAALHIMSKELDHWVWVTLFFSTSPDDDFGADRPSTLAGPWAHYKMCAVTSFSEQDGPPAASGLPPSLTGALDVVYAGAGAPSWCSNPYIELGAHNAETNCIGCHQHGGTGERSETILGAAQRFPAAGRVQVRNNFPVDYTFATHEGDRLGSFFLAARSAP